MYTHTIDVCVYSLLQSYHIDFFYLYILPLSCFWKYSIEYSMWPLRRSSLNLFV